MTGKERCELLKAIRKKIADMNGIEYHPVQCDHKGDCPGYCPMCDQEASDLMEELKKKYSSGIPIRIHFEDLDDFLDMAQTKVDSEDWSTKIEITGLRELRLQGCPL